MALGTAVSGNVKLDSLTNDSEMSLKSSLRCRVKRRASVSETLDRSSRSFNLPANDMPWIHLTIFSYPSGPGCAHVHFGNRTYISPILSPWGSISRRSCNIYIWRSYLCQDEHMMGRGTEGGGQP